MPLSKRRKKNGKTVRPEKGKQTITSRNLTNMMNTMNELDQIEAKLIREEMQRDS